MEGDPPRELSRICDVRDKLLSEASRRLKMGVASLRKPLLFSETYQLYIDTYHNLQHSISKKRYNQTMEEVL